MLLFLMRVRDETHRRAVGYHRRLRAEGMTTSALDGIPGVGPKRKRLLLNRFGDVKALSGAAPEDLAALPGISLDMARTILGSLK